MQDMQHLFLPANQTVTIRRVSSGDRKALILTWNFETFKETQGIKNCNMGLHTLPFLYLPLGYSNCSPQMPYQFPWGFSHGDSIRTVPGNSEK